MVECGRHGSGSSSSSSTKAPEIHYYTTLWNTCCQVGSSRSSLVSGENIAIVQRVGEFLAQLTVRSAVVPEVPWGPRRRMPQGINYIHGSSHRRCLVGRLRRQAERRIRRLTAAGNMHSPEMLQALRSQPKLGAVVPDIDRAFVQVFWAVPAGTSKAELAEKAIDLIFSEEMQYEFAKRGSATAVLPAARRIADEDPLWASLYPHTEEQFRSLRYYPYDAYFEHWVDIEKFWTREVLRNG